MLHKLNFPEYNFNIQKLNEVVMIYDRCRRKMVKLTPEEWVRQHVLFYLIDECRISPTKISVEKQLQLNNTLKRFDVVVFEKEARPFLLIECKAPTISINHNVFDQAVRYNLNLQVPYLWLTNGLHHITIECNYETKSCNEVAQLPFPELFQ
jgi:hypothetical protein